MAEISGIYDSGPISPVAKIKENLSIWTQGGWEHYRIDYMEPVPASPASTVEMVVASGATSLAANGTIAQRVVAILQLNTNEFFHVRFEPLDNVEGIIWEQAGQGKFRPRNVHARVDMNTRFRDPYLSTTTFFILGRDRDMNLEVRNPMGYATPVARFVFWGYRAKLKEWKFSDPTVAAKMAEGDLATVRQTLGATTWLPAEGRA